MERIRPMDRLLVGDVGYGKTEIAVRAAFKAVQCGRQVAVLVPTTILADQHCARSATGWRTFRSRRGAESLSDAERAKADARGELTDKKVDIVIGTHRLLSPDVSFDDLGLIIVDEEHRFGVKHKERLKQLRLDTDVLTLTATPIPRTLHLSLAGLRDMTLMQTPPRDRSPVLTFVEPWDDGLIDEGISRELDRGGQVFFVHNRIETIEAIADHVHRTRAARARGGRARADAGARPRGGHAAIREWRGGRARLDDDRRVGPRCAERQHDVRQSRRSFRAGAAVSAARSCGPLAPAGVLLSHGARRGRPGRRATVAGARASYRARAPGIGSR